MMNGAMDGWYSGMHSGGWGFAMVVLVVVIAAALVAAFLMRK